MLKAIAEQFELEGKVLRVEAMGSGNVNDTYRVITDAPRNNRFILQRLSRQAFPRPEQIIENILMVSRHIENRRSAGVSSHNRRSAGICSDNRSQENQRQQTKPETGRPHPTASTIARDAQNHHHRKDETDPKSGSDPHSTDTAADISSESTPYAATHPPDDSEPHASIAPCFNLQIPRLIPTNDNRFFHIDNEGGFWRAMVCIHPSHTYDVIADAEQARKIGWMLGCFHQLTADLDVALLHDPLPGFHLTPRYLALYDEAAENNPPAVGEENHRWIYCRRFVEDHRAWANPLEQAKAEGMLQNRVVHGDPKINNFLFHPISDEPLAIIDLDTIKPGPIQYDIGDCLRSCCNPAGEEPHRPDEVYFDLTLCQALLAGYAKTTGIPLRLSPNTNPEARPDFLDLPLIFEATRTITFELGLRFLTDYLLGNPYFKTQYPEQNLNRATVQFHLADSIEKQESDFKTLLTGEIW